jgi:hypothetical protein
MDDMIHQLIFAAPRPGMTEREFQDYWLNVHAVRYASRIPQIRRYLIDLRLPAAGETDDPLWSGVAEIWLASEAEQLESLQTPEFLDGARRDEPNWAAFWRTVVLDTDPHVLLAGREERSWTKLILLAKRRAGLPLDAFRKYSIGANGDLMLRVPGLRRYLQCHTRDSFYGVGEAVLDVVHQLCFDSEAELRAALDSTEYRQAREDLALVTEPGYVHELVVDEHWVIGPDSR